MRKTRIYYPGTLIQGNELALDSQSSVRVSRVLRHKVGDILVLFNGQGGEYKAHITQLDRRRVICEIEEFSNRSVESPLIIRLAQGISKGERMDYTVQKAVELGVYDIVPLVTSRTNVHLNAERQKRRIDHWQSIVYSACEQSGRNSVPEIKPIVSFSEWQDAHTDAQNIVLDPGADQGLNGIAGSITEDKPQSITVLVGPEGGLSREEISSVEKNGFIPIRCGPRILRTETAAMAAISVLQSLWGDFI